MSTFSVPLGIGPNAILSPFTDRSKALNPSIRRTQLGYLSISKHGFCTSGRLEVARFGLGQVPFPDPDGAEGIIRDLLRGAEMFMYTVADAAVSASSDALADTTTTTKQSDWLSGIIIAWAITRMNLLPAINSINKEVGHHGTSVYLER